MDIFFKIVGGCAATLTTISFLPQAVKCIVTKKTDNISLLMYILFVIGTFLWAAYGIHNQDWPVIIANVITAILSTTILVMKIMNLPKEKAARANQK